MNEAMIQKALYQYREQNGHKISIPNVYCAWGEVDFLSISRSGYCYEHEIKVSTSDFRADKKKKRKHGNISALHSKSRSLPAIHGPNYFIYVAPEGVIPINELPEYAGLMIWRPSSSRFYRNGVITPARQAKLIHKTPASPKFVTEIAHKLSLRFWKNLL